MLRNRARLKQGFRTIGFPEQPPVLPEQYPGRPRWDAGKCQADCTACVQACPEWQARAASTVQARRVPRWH